MMAKEIHEKLLDLKVYLQELGPVAVAFSGGVDSTFLLKVAHDTLGDGVTAFTASSVFVPERDVAEAREFCEKEGVHHIIRTFDTLGIDGIRFNPTNRCYLCKYALFRQFKEMAGQLGLAAVVDGTNLDDDGDYRPGRKALGELDIKSPLHQAGFTKQDIRDLSRELGLATWSKPSFACLASRFVYGEELTTENLQRINEAEELLQAKGFTQFRVRQHGSLARIELLPADIDRFMTVDIRADVAAKFRALGFDYVTLDLIGYRTGSMNEALNKEE